MHSRISENFNGFQISYKVILITTSYKGEQGIVPCRSNILDILLFTDFLLPLATTTPRGK